MIVRIRSTKPEFWRSKTIASVSWDARLVLKGLESYVDDDGDGFYCPRCGVTWDYEGGTKQLEDPGSPVCGWIEDNDLTSGYRASVIAEMATRGWKIEYFPCPLPKDHESRHMQPYRLKEADK